MSIAYGAGYAASQPFVIVLPRSAPEGDTSRIQCSEERYMPMRIVHGENSFDVWQLFPGHSMSFRIVRGRWERIESAEETRQRRRNEKRLRRGWRPRHVRASV